MDKKITIKSVKILKLSNLGVFLPTYTKQLLMVISFYLQAFFSMDTKTEAGIVQLSQVQ